MADFRKWLFAFAVVALHVGSAGSPANAQGLNAPAFSLHSKCRCAADRPCRRRYGTGR